jgi:hypothetical protein
VCPQVWQLEKLPGLSETIALMVFPRVACLRNLFNPREWHFLKIGSVYFQPCLPEALLELLEGVLYQYQMKTAVLYIDHRSPIYRELRQSRQFGILHHLVRIKVNVCGFSENLSHQQFAELHNLPLAISAVDV